MKLFRGVYPYLCDSWKLHIKLQMISFVGTNYDYYYYYYSDYLQRLHCVCLVVNPNTLGGKPKVYGGTNLGGKPRLSYITHYLQGSKSKPLHQQPIGYQVISSHTQATSPYTNPITIPQLKLPHNISINC